MRVQEILRALQANQIDLEEAKRELLKLKNGGSSPDPFACADPACPPSPPASPGEVAAIEPAPRAYSGRIAIIGMSGRYPGARDLTGYWELLRDGRSGVVEVPKERWDPAAYYDPRPQQAGKVNCKWLGALDGMAEFDPLFFMISPAEAELMDPQHRLFMQEGYRAFEDAGYGGGAVGNRKCGVYLGIMNNEYGMLLRREGALDTTGNSFAIAAARLAYFLNLKGPALPIDTACSSSLVAAHLACQGLRDGEIDLALVGGVTLYLTAEAYIGMCAAGMLSPEGQCKAFDNRADGFVPGEGVGALVLKRLEDAEADGDPIHGIIIGSGINQDGKTNGITAPSVNSQIELERAVYARHGIAPASVGYVEMHGTGTKLGDPIELEALAAVYREGGVERESCAIGSVKSNLGHTSAAAGIAGIQKVLLCLKHGHLVPSLHYRQPNEHFDFANSPFRVNTDYRPWAGDGTPKRAAVSSFGFSGTNAHLVIEEYRPKAPDRRAEAASPVLVVLSAKNEERLREQAANLKAFLERNSGIDLTQLAYTLQVGREAMEQRLALVADSQAALCAALEGYLRGEAVRGLLVGQVGAYREQEPLFDADEDAQTLLKTWIDKKKLKKIAGVWIQGLPIDWPALYGQKPPAKIHLPTYPFAKHRYWLPQISQKIPAQNFHPPAKHSPSKLDGLGYLPLWQAQALPAADREPLLDTLLIVATGASAIATAIYTYYLKNQQAKRILRIELGSRTEPLAENSWRCAINDPGAFNLALDGITAIQGFYFIAEADDELSPLAHHAVAQGISRNELQLLRLGKYLSSRKDIQHLEGYLITQGNCQLSNTLVNPYGGGITGLTYSLAQACPDWSLRHIDLMREDIATEAQCLKLVARIVKEPPNEFGAVIKYRDGLRYTQLFHPVWMPTLRETGLTPEGTYVIAGGSGTLGRIISQYLLREYQAQVIWLGRSSPEKMHQIVQSCRVGNRIPVYIQADVTDKVQLEQAIRQLKADYPRINGALFCAAIFGTDRAVADIDEQDFLDIVEVKAQGSLNFYTAFQNEALDFLCYFSSVQAFPFTDASLTPGYATGISLSESFIERLRGTSRFPVGILYWGFWKAALRGKLYSDKIGVLDDEEGFRGFECFISLLRQGMLNRLICLRASKQVQARMACPQDTVLALQALPCNWPLPENLFDMRQDAETIANLAGFLGADDLYQAITRTLFRQLRNLGLISAETSGQARIIPKYARWWEECRRVLSEAGYSAESEDNAEVFGDWEAVKPRYLAKPEWQAQIALLDVCLKNLPDILTGKLKATAVLFPNASTSLVEGIYRNNPVADYFNGLLADAVEAYIKRGIEADPDARFKLIEAGAGTGGSSAVLFTRLRPYADRIEYCYTDVSKSFLQYAEEYYGPTVAYLSYRLWDVEKTCADQGIEPGSYDIVIASNVLHATRQIRQTLRNIKTVLKTQGILLLNEVIRKDIIALVTFGLLDGWWAYEDGEIRLPGSPLLSPKAWRNILEEEGFQGVCFPAETAQILGQQVIAAASDGWIRQTLANPPAIPKAERPAQPPAMVSRQAEQVHGVIVECLSQALKVPMGEIQDSVPFSDYGVDSIIGVAFVNRINEVLGLALNSSILFDHSSVTRLANHICQSCEPRLLTQDTSATAASPDREQAGSSPNAPSVSAEPVAVIGMAGRFPGAKNVTEFWQNLMAGRDAVGELPAAYLDQARFFSETPEAGKTYCKWGGILEDRDDFDPLFFNITPREAAAMHRHQRLVLEESWKALEDAGIDPQRLADSQTGMFIGAEPTGFFHRSFTGSSDAIIASRLAYFLNLKGPALLVNTGCSSSAVAVHLACESLRRHEADLALAGGVHAHLNAQVLVALSEIGMLSPTGRCHTFDAAADGTVLSEGVGIVVLKRLSEALADHDPIYGVIAASGINQDGTSNGMTAPSGSAQERLIAELYQRHGIDPRHISYVEAHGTGTPLGDPVEVNALARAFRHFTDQAGFCTLGSAKSYIGHTGAASGVVGLIKLLLSFQHRKLPGLINFQHINPMIELQGSPFHIATSAQAWVSDLPLMAAVSAFGHSGTNAHLVLREHPPALAAPRPVGPVLIPLSAQDPARLREYAARWLAYLRHAPDALDLAALAYTLQTGRAALEYRLICLVQDRADWIAKLEAFLGDASPSTDIWQGRVRKGKAPPVAQPSLAQGPLDAIGAAWVQGVEIDWQTLYGGLKPQRIHGLPTYPFAREHYGMADDPPQTLPAPAMPSSTGAEPVAESTLAAALAGLRAILAEVTKIPVDRLDEDTLVETLGLDSVLITELNAKIAAWTGISDSTLLFRHASLGGIAAHLAEAAPGAITPHAPPGPASAHRQAAFPDRSVTREASADIAIIGLAGRYPQAATLDEFWKNLVEGRDCIEEIPAGRWPLAGFFEPDRAQALLQGLSYSKWGGFLKDIDRFDPLFFTISPKDAIFMDPQERLFLEVAWECLEDAGYTRKALEQPGAGNQIGVFVGATFNNYQLYAAEAALRAGRTVYAANSQLYSIANRVSFVLNLTGPSLTVDTACSSSLYALHLACESLQSGQARMALAGGVNLSLHPSKYITISQGQFNAADGRCRAFCEGGTGYVPAEAVGAVFLKPLRAAIEDGDHIYGIIKGTAASHAGKTNGYTVPNPVSQAVAVEHALRNSGIDARTISCIEAHGTGTALGDPIEITGLTEAFRTFTRDTGFCAISSVKSNIGHAEAAAGIAQLTKVLLQLRHKTLAPNRMHGQGLNPNIDFSTTPFVVQTQAEAWRRPQVEGREFPRRAGISSFGAGGANAHIVVEEYSPPAGPLSAADTGQPVLILLSAKQEDRLHAQAERLLAYLQAQPATDLAAMAYTLQLGREAMDERLALRVESIAELCDKLNGFLQGQAGLAGVYRGRAQRQSLGALTDADWGALLDTWMTQGQHAKLAELWVQGIECDWRKLYPAARPGKLSLPTYPFQGERYWLGTENEDSHPPLSQEPSVPAAPAEEAFELLCFAERWQAQPLSPSAPDGINTLACFVARPELGTAVVTAIHALQPEATVVLIYPAAACHQDSPHAYALPAQEQAAYTQVFQNLRDDFGRLDGILYAWPLDEPAYVQDYAPIVFILQALAATQLKPRKVLLAGRYEDGLARCYLESWLGFERSVGLAFPNTQVAAVIMDGPAAPPADWLPTLWPEWGNPRPQSVLYQHGTRHVSAIQPTMPEAAASLLRPAGTYLITGGGGGLGLLFADYCARTYQAKLILTGRSPLDPHKAARLAALEAAGAEVLYLQADVADPDAMQAGLRQAQARFGAIQGVIHAAGIEGTKIIFDKNLADFQQVLAPKIQGTRVLDAVLDTEALDFICYFSSSAAILGDFGACDYAIANRFQMAYAGYRNLLRDQGQIRGKAVVINWPLWKDGGMGRAEAAENTRMYLKSSGQRFLETQEGLAWFERLLVQPDAQHLLIPGQKSRVWRFLGLTETQPPQGVAATRPDSVAGHGRRAAMKGFDTAQCLEWDVKELISQVIKLPRHRLGRDENFADLGFDSISLAELAAALSRHFGLDITPAVFFGHSTLDRLCGYFLREQAAAIAAFYREPESSISGDSTQPTAPAPQPTPLPPADTRVPEAIAIIGMSGRFPKARTVDELWQHLVQGRNVVEPLPEDRYGAGAGRWRCGNVPGVGEFDPQFFEISPKEAIAMDPRQRLLLQEAWRALEDAGYGAEALESQRIGMYVGVEEGDYQALIGDQANITSNHNAILAARLAYFLNLHGPNLAVNTSCSSGLAAVHLACQSLRNGECDTAIAAGVNLIFTVDAFQALHAAGMLSPEGQCRAFAQDANGMVPGEAVAVLVLKRLSRAEAEGDVIHGVILGSGINYDGKTNGITAPSAVAQASLLREVYDRHRLNPEAIDYILTHGTGTPLGDPVEINALHDAFKGYTRKTGYCALTSTKSNFGHTFAASGLLSLMSLLQAFRYNTIPASLHCERESDYIPWQDSPFFVNKANRPWTGAKRLGAVSAFGMSGTNVHMVVQSHTRPLAAPVQRPYYLLALSAKTLPALHAKIDDLIAWLQAQPQDLTRVSHGLLTGRQHFSHRCAVVVQDVEDAVQVLRQVGGGEALPHLFQGKVPREFTGQKAIQQYGQTLMTQSHTDWQDRTKYRDNLYALADLYCQGYTLAWGLLYGETPPQKISLPTYPFSREHYWVNAHNPSTAQPQTVGIQSPVVEPAPQPSPKPQAISLDALASAPSISARPESTARPKIHLETPGLNEPQFQQTVSSAPPISIPIAAPNRAESPRPVPSGIGLGELQEALATSLATALFMERGDVELNKKFIDMGLDSIIGVEWMRTVNTQYGLSLPITHLYDYPTLREFAGFLHQEIAKQGETIPPTPVSVPGEPSPEPVKISHAENIPPAPRLKNEVIAIIGMSGKYPDADHLDDFWNNLSQGKDSIREIPTSRWDISQYYDPTPQPGKIYCRWIAPLAGVDAFDPGFFMISPTEAECMDPQHRLFLQEGYKAFEDAGYGGPLGLNGRKCGVYIGIVGNEYGLMLSRNRVSAQITGNTPAIAAARLAYFLNLKGPAIPIDTACSSSLVAVHLACQALLNHEIDMALTGGVSLYLTPESYLGMCEAGMLSQAGKCRSFDNDADGFVPGEGVGALVLKRLSDAEADHDHIYGLILGSGINQNGKTNGITAPSVHSQSELERDIYQRFAIDPDTIGYAEMHGAGTKLGDLIELRSLAAVFRESTARKHFCAIGSLKSNIGHTSAAAGIAGIHKVLLCLKHKQLVPTLNFAQPNEHFDFQDSPFYVNTQLRPWEACPEGGRRATVSAFGFSGSNAHLVIGEYVPSRRRDAAPPQPVLFLLSAANPERLAAYAAAMRRFLEAESTLNLADLAFTLHTGRAAMDYRLALVAESKAQISAGLTAFLDQQPTTEVLTGQVASLAVSAADPATQAELQRALQQQDLTALAGFWVQGYELDWRVYYGDQPAYRISLPTYPFAQERYWLPNPVAAAPLPHTPNRAERYVYGEPYLKDHTVHGEQVLIGVTHAALALNAYFQHHPTATAVQLQRLSFVQPVRVGQDQAVDIDIDLRPQGPGLAFEARYRLLAEADGQPAATGQLQPTTFVPGQRNLSSLMAALREYPRLDQIFSGNPAVGMGETFKILTRAYVGDGQVLAQVRLHPEARHDYVLHPHWLNSPFLAVAPLLEGVEIGAGFLPFGIKDIQFQNTGRLAAGWVLVQVTKNSGEMILFDAELLSDTGEVLARLAGCSVKRLRPGVGAPVAAPTPEPAQVSNAVHRYLSDKIGRLLDGNPHYHPEANLMDLGLESAQLVALTREIEGELGMALNPTLFFEYPSLKALVDYFLSEHRAAFAGWLTNTDPPAPVPPVVAAPKPPQMTQPAPRLSQPTAPETGDSDDDIAIIGIHGRFAEAEDLEQLWENLCGQRDLLQEIPPDHWDYRPWFDPDPEAKDKIYCKWGSFIADVDKFDAGFFNISPREAEWMDPQLRLLLQSIYATAEDAGYIQQLRGTSTGVFVGVCSHDYADRIAELNLPMNPFIGTGISQAVIANRVSFYFDLLGPSMTIDTACSSSLFALHSACQALRNRECSMAFVAGVNLLLSSFHYRYFCSIGALSASGRCHSFDAAADGYVPGECIASVLLKPLRQARQDQDRIYAVIKGSAALHGGYTPSLTAPSVAGEENVIVKAWESAKINPETLGYIEAHGTGTKLGDPIEINSLKKAFARFTTKERFCAVGSLKAHLGHTEGAAGIAGIIKVVLQLRHQALPAMPRFNTLNPYIQLDASPLYINPGLEAWHTEPGVPRRAGVSAFGFSGAYAHVVLEEYLPDDRPPAESTGPVAIVLSAKNAARLQEVAQRLRDVLKARGYTDGDLADIAYTLQIGRQAMEERVAFLASSIAEMLDRLEQFLRGQPSQEGLWRGQVKRAKNAGETPVAPSLSGIAEADLAGLVADWVLGREFDWHRLYGPVKPRRIGLPTYPFARERHWIPVAPIAETPSLPNPPALGTCAVPEPRTLVSAEALATAYAPPAPKPVAIALTPLSSAVSPPSPPEARLDPIAEPRPVAPSKPVAERVPSGIDLAALEAELTASLAEALFMPSEDIDPERQFVDLGVDSIIGVEWTKTLNKHYSITLQTTKLYDHPSVREFAAYLAQELAKQTASISPVAPQPETPEPLPPLPERPNPIPSSAAETSVPPTLHTPNRPSVHADLAPTPPPSAKPRTYSGRIAIIGMSGRYPGARDLTGYWELLRDGRSGVVDVPKERWDPAAYYDPRPQQVGKVNCKWLGALDGIAEFDPLFFMISPAEAELMDPQHRLFMQEGYRAFEDAGYGGGAVGNRKCGVYLGIMNNEYGMLLRREGALDTTGNSFAIAAARLAYFLNLKGPALPIDTACSSSLVAAHLACQGLRDGEIDLALVGGVTLYLTAEAYIGMCAAGMLSPEGQCKAFDNSADGFVPGEGVGALVLKRLEDAEADGDPIHGVIIGSGINQDGKTNGITAPSVNSQIELERAVYARHGIAPASVGYVEMHGTGTKLGDPIELEALAAVYREGGVERESCAIGSVKSNLGHTSAAAGIAGIQKVLLCLKHGHLVPSLHYRQPNEHFDFANSPFRVNTDYRPWTGDGAPKRAAVSSFGFSGTNAHLVIEEYRPKAPDRRTETTSPVLVVLSAKNEERLREQAANLKAFLERNNGIDLAQLAYTLQVGREAMEQRLALVAESQAALCAALERYCQGGVGRGLFTGRVKKYRSEVSIFEADEDAQSLLQTWISKKKLTKVAELWVKGLAIDWQALSGARGLRKINLPTYPFARETYWIPAAKGGNTTPNPALAQLHPLLHSNTSTLTEHRYTSCFTGQEPFLVDHIVKGQRVLPGVTHLEMARAAVEQASEGLPGQAITLRNTVWVYPLVVETAPTAIHIRLTPQPDGGIAYQIYSLPADPAAAVIHSQGVATWEAPPAPSGLDIDAIRATCTRKTVHGAEFYQDIGQKGLDYGPSHRGIERLYLGAGQVLARLVLPDGGPEPYVLHPGLMDSALQASTGLLENYDDFKPILPAIDEIRIPGRCGTTMWAWVRRVDSLPGSRVEKFDIDICDDTGLICVSLRGFASLAVVDEGMPTPTGGDTLMLVPTWEAMIPDYGCHLPAPGERVVLVGHRPDLEERLREKCPTLTVLDEAVGANSELIAAQLSQQGGVDHICWIANHRAASVDAAVIATQNDAVLSLFRWLKALLALGYGQRALAWTIITTQAQPVYPHEPVNLAQAGLIGLVGSLAKEYPRWQVRLVDLADADAPPPELFTLPPDPEGNPWSYREGEWYQQQLLPFHAGPLTQTRYRQGGVYVVIGGAGGLGEAWSEYMIRRYQARIIWIGRRPLDAAIQAKLDRLGALGMAPEYVQADVTDGAALQAAYAAIKQRHIQIHGVIHAAIVLLDSTLENMDEARFRAGLAAKVDTGIHMAQVFGAEPLDFILFFSSLATFSKAAGQSNYAAGCTFIDALAHHLVQTLPGAVKVMNWGYWGSVGAVASEDYRQRMAQAGIGSIEPPEAMVALETLLASPIDQLALLKTTQH